MIEYEKDRDSAGNGKEAVNLINEAEKVIDTVLRLGSSSSGLWRSNQST